MKNFVYFLLFLCCLAFGQDHGRPVYVVDGRDNQKYKAVRIGDHVWMARNLNYNSGIFNSSWCNDCKVYGRLYDWDTAKKACPEGWHLPSRKEWNDLIKTVSFASRLRSARWNNGADDFEFDALPGGYLFSSGLMGTDYINVGANGYWWTSTEDVDGNAFVKYMGSDYDEVPEWSQRKSRGFSVRCVKSFD
ncbi:MAG: hypothetical protein FWB90_01095 [Fibromonadales bacterium]|nr:hypothetical protein [Fibromonadales bacterium]